jgi:hypothetical protein
MTEPRKSAPAAAKKTAAPAPAAPEALDALSGFESRMLAALADHTAAVNAVHSSLAELHTKFDALKERADRAEKLMNSPAAKALSGAQKLWKGLG